LRPCDHIDDRIADAENVEAGGGHGADH
jgi:hypothetical protein